MKSFLTLFIASCLLCSNSWAQMSTAYVQDEKSSHGLRLTLLKGSSNVRLDGSYSSYLIFGDVKYDSAFGIAAGYANLNVEELGYTSNFSFIQYKGSDSAAAAAVRVDANLAYAFNSTISIKGGANMMKFTQSEYLKDFDPSLGLQASLGLQINPTFGLDFGYMQMKTTGSLPIYGSGSGAPIGEASATATISGLEIAAHATF